MTMIIKNQTLLLQLDESQTSVLLELLRAGAKALAQPDSGSVLFVECKPSGRLYNAIRYTIDKRSHLITLGDIVNAYSKTSVLKIRNMGVATMKELDDLLESHGLQLPD